MSSAMIPVTATTIPVAVGSQENQVGARNEEEPQGATAAVASTGLAEGSTMEPLSAEPPKYTFSVPPTYNVASELPSYDDVQRMKIEEEKQREMDPAHDLMNVDPFSGEDTILGTDLTFLSAFFVSFLFNWIGFLLLMCFCHTVAGRYGALAGFGLSLAKWTLIVKHSTELINQENSWLGWLVLAFGMLICVRSILQYVHIKREWRLLTRTAQERLLYFY